MLKNKLHNFSWMSNKLNTTRYPAYAQILAINGLVYLAWSSYFFSQNFLLKHLALSKDNLSRGRVYTLLTHSFTHINFFHILSNSVAIYFLGQHIERMMGSKTFLKLYLAGAIAGGCFQLIFQGNYDRRPMIGASDSVSALLAFFTLKYPEARMFIFPFPFPVKAWWFGMFYFLYSFMNANSTGYIGHSGHLGGFLSGAFYFFILRGRLY